MQGKAQPAFIGGLILGVLSALPIVNVGNVCCCLWVVSGGVIAAYLLQQNQATPITPGDGALVGLFAGLIGAFVYLVISIPISLIMAPLQREFFQRFLENNERMPPELRDLVGTGVGVGIARFIGFMLMLCVGTVFATLGGLLGSVMFRKPAAPPGTIEVPPPSP